MNKIMKTREHIEVIKKKLYSMRYSKKEVQKETSRDAKQFMYGYSECINDLLEYLHAGGDGLPEHELCPDGSKRDEYLPDVNFREDIANELSRDELINRLCEMNKLYQQMRKEWFEMTLKQEPIRCPNCGKLIGNCDASCYYKDDATVSLDKQVIAMQEELIEAMSNLISCFNNEETRKYYAGNFIRINKAKQELAALRTNKQ